MPVFTADDRRCRVVTEADLYWLVAEDGLIFRRSCAVGLRDVERERHRDTAPRSPHPLRRQRWFSQKVASGITEVS
jgi:hypothetical protein